MIRRSALLACLLPALTLAPGIASARPPSIESLRNGETIRIRIDMASGHDEFLFSGDKVSIKERDKLRGELTLTQEDKRLLDRYLAMIGKKHDDHTAHSTLFTITLQRGEKVLATHKCEVGSPVRETKKETLSLGTPPRPPPQTKGEIARIPTRRKDGRRGRGTSTPTALGWEAMPNLAGFSTMASNR